MSVAELTEQTVHESTRRRLPWRRERDDLIRGVSGGFLFGTWLGALYIVIGATVGATVLFVIAKSALGDFLRTRAGPWPSRHATRPMAAT